MTTVATIKGGAVSSLSTTGGLFSFVNSLLVSLTKSTLLRTGASGIQFSRGSKRGLLSEGPKAALLMS